MEEIQALEDKMRGSACIYQGFQIEKRETKFKKVTVKILQNFQND